MSQGRGIERKRTRRRDEGECEVNENEKERVNLNVKVERVVAQKRGEESDGERGINKEWQREK